MNPEDINIIEKLEQAASEILGKPIPFKALAQFMAAVECPEIPKLKPVTQRPRELNPELWRHPSPVKSGS